ncbi:MAG: hypothetical protein ACKPGG_18645, partial [Microcystis panniformis]
REDIDKNSNHKKQIPNIYQAIIFISKYSTRLSPDKQDGLPLLPNHYPFGILSMTTMHSKAKD